MPSKVRAVGFSHARHVKVAATPILRDKVAIDAGQPFLGGKLVIRRKQALRNCLISGVPRFVHEVGIFHRTSNVPARVRLDRGEERIFMLRKVDNERSVVDASAIRERRAAVIILHEVDANGRRILVEPHLAAGDEILPMQYHAVWNNQRRRVAFPGDAVASGP